MKNLELREPVLKVTSLHEDHEHTIARIVLRGLNRPVINHLSSTTYEVLCGEGTMEIDFAVHELRPGVEITVPAGTPYQDEGELLMLATTKPPFESSAVEFLDEE